MSVFEMLTFDSDYIVDKYLSIGDYSLLNSSIVTGYKRVFFAKNATVAAECDILVVLVEDYATFQNIEIRTDASCVIYTTKPFETLSKYLNLKEIGKKTLFIDAFGICVLRSINQSQPTHTICSYLKKHGAINSTSLLAVNQSLINYPFIVKKRKIHFRELESSEDNDLDVRDDFYSSSNHEKGFNSSV
jgi:hypothetical protein